ncbi:UDP-Glycosyltransferase/glycogen phosphorylase [Hesseltinella vesiculosa]|uniref:UDP-Glycosyltransferase/glycogen phosphorylase n=1 Tax=Hesseltinella vesiculosa TaxID=101127 RepID=A0A1X2GNU5_9FUNG|nr:UDP-Glycosyltransferase/glycogen phosphorylase [Hesseltinella vesiculosa]
MFCPESGHSHYAGAELVGTRGIPFLPYPELSLNLWRPTFTDKLLAFEPDVIHLVDPVWLGAAALAVCKIFQQDRLAAIPIVASYHTNLATYCHHFGWGLFSPLMWRWNLFCHSYCRYTVCPSPSTKDMLLTHGFHNVRLWPRGVSMTRFSPRHRSQDVRSSVFFANSSAANHKQAILYVGRVSHEKNLKMIIDTYQHMDHARCHLVIIGDGPAKDALKQTCAQRRLSVTFTGYLFGHDLAAAFASADLFVFPSTTETFGQVVLEAMSSGLPVCALLAEGVRDLVQHGHTGLLLDTHASYEHQCLQYRRDWEAILYNPVKRQQMAAMAVEAAKAYTWPNALERMVQVYKDAVRSDHEASLSTATTTCASPSTDQPTVIDMKDASHDPQSFNPT